MNTRARNFILFLLNTLGVGLLWGGVSLDLLTHPRQYGVGNLQIAISAIGLALSVGSNILLIPNREGKTLLPALPLLTIFLTSIALLGLNLYGEIVPLRNPAVYEGIEYGGKVRTARFAPEEVYRKMNRNAAIDEQYPAYVKRLTELVYNSTVHYWEENDPENRFNLRIPARENFLIYLLSHLRGETGNYEFCRAERAIERAASVCSQASKILLDILQRNRVKAAIIGLDGHVVVRARVDKETDTWWLLDADYGVVIEHDIDEVETNPELVGEAYRQAGYNEAIVETLMEIYGPEGNTIIDDNPECGEEDYLYLLKWLLPLLGLLPFLTYQFTEWAYSRKN